MSTAAKIKSAKTAGMHDPKQEVQQPHAATAPVQSQEGNSAEASDLSTEWPSSSFAPVLPDVLELLKRAHRILTTGGFLLVGDPLNPLGDGRSWVLRCEPTNKLPRDADSADSARRRLESEGVKVDETYKREQNDQTFKVARSPLSRPNAPAKAQENLHTELLSKIYGITDLGPIPSNRAIEEGDIRAHDGPSPEGTLGEAWKWAKRSVHITSREAAEGKAVLSAESVNGSGQPAPAKGLRRSPKARVKATRQASGKSHSGIVVLESSIGI